MITTLTTFNLPEAITVDEVREIFRNTSSRYQGMPGLLRKQYVVSED